LLITSQTMFGAFPLTSAPKIELTDKILQITLPFEPTADRLNWTASIDGRLSNKLTFAFYAGNRPIVDWSKMLWNTHIPPSRSFVCWHLLHNKIPTDDNLRKRGCLIVSIYCFFMKEAESSDHIFLQCPFTSQILDWLWLSVRSVHLQEPSPGYGW